MGTSASEALLCAVSAIYFDDSSDYETALYEIVRCLGGQDMAEELMNNPSAAYHQAMRMNEIEGGDK